MDAKAPKIQRHEGLRKFGQRQQKIIASRKGSSSVTEHPRKTRRKRKYITCITAYTLLSSPSPILAAIQPKLNHNIAEIKLPHNWPEQSNVESFNQFLTLRQIKPESTNGKIKLSEADLVVIAMANSPEIRSAIYQYKQADYQVRSAYGAYYPNISAFNSSLSYNYSNSTFEFGGPNWGSTVIEKKRKKQIDQGNSGITSIYQGLLGLQISFNLLDVPRDLGIAEAMESREYYHKLLSYAVKQKLQSVQLAVLSIQAADQLISAYSQSAKFAKSAYEQILMSYQKGYATKIDVNNYYALYNAYQANVATSLSSRQSALSQLLGQLSWPQTIVIDVDGSMKQPKSWPLSLEDSLRYGRQNSEQVQTLMIQSKINHIQAKNEIAAYLPVLSLNAYGYKNSQIGSIYIDDPSGTTNSSVNSAVSLNLNWTLFDGFTSLNNSKAYKQSMLSYKEQSEAQRYSVEQSINSYDASIKANTVAYAFNAKAFEAQTELTNLTLIGYKSGYNTVFDLVNAQQNSVNSLIGQIQSLQNVNSSLIQIQTNTGAYLCNDPVVKYACNLLKVFKSSDFTDLDQKNQ